MTETKLCAAGRTLIEQIDRRWPNRDKSDVNCIEDSANQTQVVYSIDISKYFFDKGRGAQQSKRLAVELAEYCREGKDDGRIAYIEYNGQIASANEDNWNFHGTDHGNVEHLHIFFTNNAQNDDSLFKLPIFRFFEDEFKSEPVEEYAGDPEMYKFLPKYPGKSYLKQGQKNEYVREIQLQLIRKGFFKSQPTGEYNEDTVEAVKKYLGFSGPNINGKEINEAGWRRIIGGYKPGIPNGKLD